MNSLLKFDNYDVEVLSVNDKVLFNPNHVGLCLELSESAVKQQLKRMNDRQVVKVRNSDVSEGTICTNRKFNNRGENFITESGVYKMIFASRCKGALKFQDWVTDEVLPSIRRNQYYIHENISEEKLKQLESDVAKQRDKIRLLNGQIRQHKFFEKQITGAWITMNWDLDIYRVGDISMEMDFVKGFVGRYLNKHGMPKVDRESIQRVRFMDYKLQISRTCLESIVRAYSVSNINKMFNAK